ncbi:hypothetical protein [Oceanidesulfovibrio indonesiensis]|uniref:hypothetical protein n=1 Tax=Oceanidesulfovibrio indonesiensis TaxID=54767 RepID=UPI001294748F|nr:hypothetical protein [Oceanidesulfovibrio indonesiensis]
MAEEKNYIVRGIIIGASAGILLSFTGYVEMGRGAALGMIGGFIAGLTLAKRRQGKD